MSAVGILIILLIVVVLTSIFFIRRLILQSERYEEIAIASHKENQQLWAFLIEVRDEIKNNHLEMKKIDNRGIFEKDDHVGFVFSGLLKLSDNLYDFISNRFSKVDDTDEEG